MSHNLHIGGYYLFMFEKVRKYFSEARQEFRHVNWPTRQEIVRLTSVVISVSLVLAVFLGAFDYLFVQVLQKFILQ